MFSVLPRQNLFNISGLRGNSSIFPQKNYHKTSLKFGCFIPIAKTYPPSQPCSKCLGLLSLFYFL